MFRLNSQSLMISKTNTTVSLRNSFFENIYFNNTIIELSSFNETIIENILFKNFSTFSGMKINNGNASKLIMNSMQFTNLNVEYNFFMFDSLYSTLEINDLYFLTVVHTKSKFFFDYHK